MSRKTRITPGLKRHTNKHHVYPTSRFILKKNAVIHTAWHDVFENSTPEEAVEKVEAWTIDPERFKEEILENDGKTRAWKILFGSLDTPLDEVLRIIKSDWTFPKVKMIKINNRGH